MTERIPLILDVDTGIDDALAIAYAVGSPDAQLVAVTTLAGNIGVERTTQNTLDVLDLLGRTDVPVHRGASKPLVRPHLDAVYFHDVNGLGGAILPHSDREIGADRGPAAMIRLSKARPGELTLVCVGPLTNLAIALNVDPDFGRRLRRLVIMGGAFHVPGNTTPYGEFNILCDPEAAIEVLQAQLPETIFIGLDVTHQTALKREVWEATTEALRAGKAGPAARLASAVAERVFVERGLLGTYLHDPLAVAVALDPSLVETESVSFSIATGEPERGQTTVVGPGELKVAIGVNAERFGERFHERLQLHRHGD
ncbi:MAG: nucleoside hydrolase [Thermomicrobiales bacterium]